MTVKASMRPALILATGLLLCLAAPSYAAPDTDDTAATTASESAAAPVALHKNAKQGARHWKKYTHRRSSKVALKPSDDKKPSDDNKAPDNKNPVAAGDSDHSSAVPPSAMPPSVANANAQLASTDTPTGNAAMAMTARANDILQAMPPQKPADAQPAAETQVVAADQLNDLDRALRESPPPAAAAPAAAPAASTAPAMAPAEPPATPPVAPVTAASSESSSWDQTSLIGKIFITFGALLTMASAARMFMA
jgi:hypothetical protein